MSTEPDPALPQLHEAGVRVGVEHAPHRAFCEPPRRLYRTSNAPLTGHPAPDPRGPKAETAGTRRLQRSLNILLEIQHEVKVSSCITRNVLQTRSLPHL